MSTYKKRCFLQVVAITVVAGFLNSSTSSAKVLFLAHYNNATADADYALGSPTASGAGGHPVAGTTAPGDGKWGRGLDQRTNGDGRCAYNALGNLDPLKGTADFWFVLDDDYPEVTVQPVFGWFNPPANATRAFYVHFSGQYDYLAFNFADPDPAVATIASEQVFTPVVGQWYHVEINWDCTGGDGESTYNFYIDGQRFLRKTGWNALGSPGGQIRVGVWGFLEGFFLHGRIDELRITDRVEHVNNFAPPTEEYATPGTPAGVAESYAKLLHEANRLEEEIGDLSRIVDITRSTAASWLDPAGDSIQAARLAVIEATADMYERGIVDTYNETTVNIGFLRDELEGLRRAIIYIQEFVDTRPSALIVSQANQTITEVVNDAGVVSDSFHNLFVSAAERADPVAGLGTLARDPVKREIMENCAEASTAMALQVAGARKSIGDEIRRLRNDAGFRAAFPDDRPYLPEPLPPVEVAADGSVERIIFAGNYGRADTVMRLGFDTFPSAIGGIEWNAYPDDFSYVVKPDYAAYVEKYQNKCAYIQMTYATGADMYRPTNPDWFASVFGDDPDFYFAPEVKGGGRFDYRHPTPRAYLLDYLEGAAREVANDARHLFYKGPWEAHPYWGVGPWQFQEYGTSVPAIAAFRVYLQNKYGVIEDLNTAWESSYADYSEIDPPEPIIMGFHEASDERGRGVYFPYWPVKRLPATPLTYEFERCRKDLYAEYFSECYQAIKRGDPMRPVGSSTSGGIYDEIMVNSLDDLQIPDKCVDLWGKHPSGGIGWHDSPYMWGLNRYFNKTLVCLEYYGYGFEEFEPGYGASFLAKGSTVDSAYNAMRRDIWHDTSWDRRLLDFYWPGRFIEFRVEPGENWLSDGINPFQAPILTPWSSAIPVVKRRASNLNDILMNTPIVKPKIAILHAGVSIINAYPTDGSRFAVADAMDRMLAMQYHFDFVAEKFLLNDPLDPRVHHDSLDGYDVVILPYVQYFDDGFAAKLLSWVSNGGTLIALGPFGLKDKLGFDISDGAGLVYPNATFSYTDPDYPLSWLWEVSGSPSFAHGYDIVSYGSGTVMTTLDGRALYRPVVGIGAGTRETARPPASDIVDPGGYSPAQQAFYDTLAAATARKAWVTSGNVEMVIRQDEGGTGPLYISLLNWDYRHALTTSVMIDGEYSRVTDLSIPDGFPVPAAVHAGQTRIPMKLGPGEGLMLMLEESI